MSRDVTLIRYLLACTQLWLNHYSHDVFRGSTALEFGIDIGWDSIYLSGCKQSYGYQFRLTSGKAGQINCTSGLYADPSLAQTLNPDETVTVGDITCFVSEVTARCDSKNGHFIVLGPEVWARG